MLAALAEHGLEVVEDELGDCGLDFWLAEPQSL